MNYTVYTYIHVHVHAHRPGMCTSVHAETIKFEGILIGRGK